MVDKTKNLTIDSKKLMRLTVAQRAQAASNPNVRSYLETLTPVEYARLFPKYYRDKLPDIGLTAPTTGGAIPSGGGSTGAIYPPTYSPAPSGGGGGGGTTPSSGGVGSTVGSSAATPAWFSKIIKSEVAPVSETQKIPNYRITDKAISKSRERFANELKDPELMRRFQLLIKAEVGSMGPVAHTAFVETVFNRSMIQGVSLRATIENRVSGTGKVYSDPLRRGYYQPLNRGGTITSGKIRGFNDKESEQFMSAISQALGGSNTTDGGTHNASGSWGKKHIREVRGNNVQNKNGELTYNKPGETERVHSYWKRTAEEVGKTETVSGGIPGVDIPKSDESKTGAIFPGQKKDKVSFEQATGEDLYEVAQRKRTDFNFKGFERSRSNCGRGTGAVVDAIFGTEYTKGGIGANAGNFAGKNPKHFIPQLYNSPQSLPENYVNDPSQWRIGDVVASVNKGYGHIQTWNGKQWVSDYKQRGINVRGNSGFTLHRARTESLSRIHPEYLKKFDQNGTVRKFLQDNGISPGESPELGVRNPNETNLPEIEKPQGYDSWPEELRNSIQKDLTPHQQKSLFEFLKKQPDFNLIEHFEKNKEKGEVSFKEEDLKTYIGGFTEIEDVPTSGTSPGSREFGMEWVDQQGRRHPIRGGRGHAGLDIEGNIQQPFRAHLDGEVIRMGNDERGYGNFIDVKLSDGSIHRMAHNHSYPSNIKVGAKFKKNDTLLYMGYTGNSDPKNGGSGWVHVHQETWVDKTIGGRKYTADEAYRASANKGSREGIIYRSNPRTYWQEHQKRISEETSRRNAPETEVQKENYRLIANEPFYAGKELSDSQYAAIDAGLSMNNAYSDDVMEAYNNAKKKREGGAAQPTAEVVRERVEKLTVQGVLGDLGGAKYPSLTSEELEAINATPGAAERIANEIRSNPMAKSIFATPDAIASRIRQDENYNKMLAAHRKKIKEEQEKAKTQAVTPKTEQAPAAPVSAAPTEAPPPEQKPVEGSPPSEQKPAEEAPKAMSTGGTIDIPPGENLALVKTQGNEVDSEDLTPKNIVAFANDRETFTQLRVDPATISGEQTENRVAQSDDVTNQMSIGTPSKPISDSSSIDYNSIMKSVAEYRDIGQNTPSAQRAYERTKFVEGRTMGTAMNRFGPLTA